MDSLGRRQFLQSALLAAGASSLGTNLLFGQSRGAETTVEPYVSGEERTGQPGISALEVHLKPVRLITVDFPAADGESPKRRLIWYLCYRAVNRPVKGVPPAAANEAPVESDEEKTHLFVPEFTLVTDDNNEQKIYIDRVMPAAQAAISKRHKAKYRNSVEIVGPLPPVTPYDAKTEKSLYGVATWRAIDARADRFKIYMGGFSNGYKVLKGQGADGQDAVVRKTLVQEYWRPGDQFEQDETEFRPMGQPKWIYR